VRAKAHAAIARLNGHAVKLIVAMNGIGKDYAGAAGPPFDLGQIVSCAYP
jgi:hypothetical protein